MEVWIAIRHEPHCIFATHRCLRSRCRAMHFALTGNSEEYFLTYWVCKGCSIPQSRFVQSTNTRLNAQLNSISLSLETLVTGLFHAWNEGNTKGVRIFFVSVMSWWSYFDAIHSISIYLRQYKSSARARTSKQPWKSVPMNKRHSHSYHHTIIIKTKISKYQWGGCVTCESVRAARGPCVIVHALNQHQHIFQIILNAIAWRRSLLASNAFAYNNEWGSPSHHRRRIRYDLVECSNAFHCNLLCSNKVSYICNEVFVK